MIVTFRASAECFASLCCSVSYRVPTVCKALFYGLYTDHLSTSLNPYDMLKYNNSAAANI